MALPLLTTIRQAVWAAINNYEPLNDVFVTKFDDEEIHSLAGPERIPAIGQMPSIEVRPVSCRTVWKNNQSQELTYTLSIVVYTPRLDCRPIEQIWELLVRALWQSKPDDGDSRSYLKRIDGLVENLTDLNTPTNFGLTKENAEGVRHDMQIPLTVNWNPRTATTPLDYRG